MITFTFRAVTCPDPSKPPVEAHALAAFSFPESKLCSPGVQSQLHHQLQILIDTVINKSLPEVSTQTTLKLAIDELQKLLDNKEEKHEAIIITKDVLPYDTEELVFQIRVKPILERD